MQIHRIMRGITEWQEAHRPMEHPRARALVETSSLRDYQGNCIRKATQPEMVAWSETFSRPGYFHKCHSLLEKYGDLLVVRKKKTNSKGLWMCQSARTPFEQTIALFADCEICDCLHQTAKKSCRDSRNALGA
jgi:hypothetical protein